MIINEIIAIIHLIIAAVIAHGGIINFHPVTSPLPPLPPLLPLLPLLPGTMVSGPFMLDLDNLIQLWGVQRTHTAAASSGEFYPTKSQEHTLAFSAESVLLHHTGFQ